MKTDQPSVSPPRKRGSQTAHPARERVLPRTYQPMTARGGAMLAANRVLDVTLAAALLAAMALPMLVIAALVRATSRGPSLYRQVRTGFCGRPFVMYKFRTMHVDAERETGPVWSRRGDPRCTFVGNLLRRFCLDELPQLFNVLKGDMSLVGPRPERPFFVVQFSRTVAEYNDRHQVLPGITGWAQINGWRGDSSLEKRVEFDLFYIRNWSLWFNVKILLLTPFRLLVDQNGS
jgi:exopolysaccharide biosynthesis polyprenyl glycosylphosphotransferase